MDRGIRLEITGIAQNVHKLLQMWGAFGARESREGCRFMGTFEKTLSFQGHLLIESGQNDLGKYLGASSRVELEIRT
jgi:hypothetical protein